ncbi:bi-domain-containing oxidoreductase [Candidatus Uabimicrobium amorphum]|uniref:Oxidoreductase n=1 Tax=Uabimicrobium amorphum TaxID=2596890 RepID=A0A5S9IHU3_UABAM|nr:bi-domain-containing oxidoreductase [Candidatus Uabimicrobium amorphum]BBM81682.1 oxidoreductase [Candidatus Uabimicrobium amorphum]
MKQLLQNLKTGEISIATLPEPSLQKGHLLIETATSLISAGTERMLLQFGRAGMIGKARQQPDKVKQVLYKIQQEGLLPTMEAVFSRLDEPMPLGYSNVGRIVAVGEDVANFQVGDRVVSNGAHAEFVSIPQNLCAKIPDNVDDEQAAFTILGAIALQGIRLCQPTIGETVVVVGLGVIGQLAAQILHSSGVNVLATDMDATRVQIAQQLGIKALHITPDTDVVSYAIEESGGNGVDGVVITAATHSNEPIVQSAAMCRKRGRIVLVGVVGLDIPRNIFYEKELSFQVSCSYGAGRYDKLYEEKGHDYPIAYVRWTENRNFQTILQLISQQKLHILPLVSDKFRLEEAQTAYDKILSKEKTLGVVLQYAAQKNRETRIDFVTHKEQQQQIAVGIIGAGVFSKRTLLPILRKQKVQVVGIASQRGLNASHLAKKYNIGYATSNYQDLLKDEKINAIFITTPHHLHAQMILECFRYKKHTFVEKPLCIHEKELDEISAAYKKLDNILFTVGFNRRFAPHSKKIQSLLANENAAKCIHITVNSGFLPSDHWLQDLKVGGGRIVGEGCHFIDLALFFAQSTITSVYATSIQSNADNVTLQLTFANKSIATIHYWSNGHKSYPKEKVEIYCNGKILILDNFKQLRGYGYPSFRKFHLRNQDKGHSNEVQCFFDSLQNAKSCISFAEMYQVTKTSFAAMESLKTGNAISL